MSTTLQINRYGRRASGGFQNRKAELYYRDHKIISPLIFDSLNQERQKELALNKQSFIGDGCGTALSSKIADLLIGKKEIFCDDTNLSNLLKEVQTDGYLCDCEWWNQSREIPVVSDES